jgi:hypothetical protein
MSAFTSAAQGDNCCGQRKNSFNLPKTFHDLCSLGCGLVEEESTRIRKGLQEALWYCSSPASPANGDHTLAVISQAASTWQKYHTELDYEKQYQKHCKTHRARACHSKPRYLEHHHDGIDNVAGRLEASPKIYARARLHERVCSGQRQT